jgi:hypothetical protein
VTPARTLFATLCCAAAAVGIAWASGAPLALEPADAAAIRLSWRAVGEPVEACRTPSAEEQAGLPQHMRRGEICERRLAPFRLEVRLDGAAQIDERIAPEGAQADRPAYVLRELRVAPGTHRLAVRFAPESGGAPALELDAEFALAPREVALVTTAPEGDRLEIRRRGGPR